MRFRVAGVLLALSSACAQTDGSPGRGVLVIAVDALRADHVQSMGYDRKTTPFLDALASEGTSFDSAWSPGPGVTPAHVSLLTGCDPLIARVPARRDGSGQAPLVSWKIPEQVPRVAVEFLANGFTTAAFVDHQVIGGLRGFDQGFVDWNDFGGGARAEDFELGVQGVGLRFLDWLKERQFEEDWFAYVHMNDLERIWQAPTGDLPVVFEPRPELASVPPVGVGEPVFHALAPSRWNGEERSLGELEALYDSAIVELDRNLARLFGQMRRRKQWERTTVVVAGTFGVGFGESGLIAASGSLSEVDLHVPLLIRPASGLLGQVVPRVEHAVSLVDLPPTLLALAGLSAPAGMHGLSLLPSMQGGPAPSREFVFASCYLHEGYAVLDERYSFELSHPGSRGGSLLAHSWFGFEAARYSEKREVVHDRLAESAPGQPSVSDGRLKRRMRAAGEDWYGLIDRARDVLHRLPWDPERPDPVEVAELRARGVLGAWP